jgi:hypothetical protein
METQVSHSLHLLREKGGREGKGEVGGEKISEKERGKKDERERGNGLSHTYTHIQTDR